MDKYGIEKELNSCYGEINCDYMTFHRAPSCQYANLVDCILTEFSESSRNYRNEQLFTASRGRRKVIDVGHIDDCFDKYPLANRFDYIIANNISNKIRKKCTERYQLVKNAPIGLPNTSAARDMKESWREFVTFIESKGSEFRNLDEKIYHDLGRKYLSLELSEFLSGYYLMAKGVADLALVDHVYNILEGKALEALRWQKAGQNIGKKYSSVGYIRSDFEESIDNNVEFLIESFLFSKFFPVDRAFMPELVSSNRHSGSFIFASLFNVRTNELAELIFKIVHEITLGQIE